MTELHALGPIGFRGPAARRVPDHLTVIDDGIRTAQHISPGVRCRSNALIAEVLDITGEDLLFITSANTSSHRSQQPEAAHCEMDEIAREFGHRRDIVMIGHDDEGPVLTFPEVELFPPALAERTEAQVRGLPVQKVHGLRQRLHGVLRLLLVAFRHRDLLFNNVSQIQSRTQGSALAEHTSILGFLYP